jgi:hypothetical protein
MNTIYRKNKNFSNIILILICGLLFGLVSSSCEFQKTPDKLTINDKKKKNAIYPEWLNGSWDGELFYHHIDKSLRVVLFFESGKLRLSYPDKKCISNIELSFSENGSMFLKEVSMQGSCYKANKIILIPYKKDKMVTKNIFSLSDIETIYLQYPKTMNENQLLSGWLTKT